MKKKAVSLIKSGVQIPVGKKTLNLKVPVKLESGENVVEIVVCPDTFQPGECPEK